MTKQTQHMTPAQLEYAKADCEAAVYANPFGIKSDEYKALKLACDHERFRRDRTRALRRSAAFLTDTLALRNMGIRSTAGTWLRTMEWEARYSLALDKLYARKSASGI
jgi:hypothetical protein